MLRCDRVTVSYGALRALDAVSLEAPLGRILGVMGASGSGKSTLLRAVAGLVAIDSGEISWQGRNLAPQPPHRRGFGLMFQDYVLFPHMTVGENVGFGLEMTGRSSQTREAVAELLELVGLAGYSDRSPAELSGGEQQRVALARTLAPEPQLILLDEPLGALDRARRDQLLSDMQRIFADRRVTALYVTHDHQEAFAVADDVAVLSAGRLVRLGTPQELWSDPQDRAVAALLGFPILSGVAVIGGTAALAGATFPLPVADGTNDIALLPGAVSVAADGAVPVRVIATRFESGETRALVDLAGNELLALAPPDVAPGPAAANIDPRRVRVLG